MADFTKFRTSIGGFNRDDVVHYIETASVEHLKELRQVKDANEKLEAEKAALRAELDETKKKLTAANAKLDRMTVEDASLQQQVETLAQEAAELAVIHSSAYKAGAGAKVAVDTTEVKNIWKANGAKPGMVLYEVYTTVYVTPRDGLAEQLKKK